MAKIMVLPKIGVNMTEALITEWVVREGDSIREGQHILDAETDKATQEIFATMSGVIARIVAQPGQTVEILQPIAVVAQEGETLTGADIDALLGNPAPGGTPPGPQTAARSEEVAPTSGSDAPQNTDPADFPGTGRVKISPLAKKIAGQMNIDIRLLRPERPGERICKNDVLRYAAEQSAAERHAGPISAVPAPAPALPLSATRRAIAARMGESNATKPTVPLMLSADMTRFLQWRDALADAGGPVGLTSLLVLAVARTLPDFPLVNARMVSDTIETPSEVHIGVAADTERGLVVPVIRHADRKGARQIDTELRALADAAKNGRLSASDMGGATFTISNLGMFEIESFAPIINPPECCILGVGAVVKKPVVDGEAVVIRPMMSLTLCFDHRIIDGAPAARFLQRVKHALQNPLSLLS